MNQTALLISRTAFFVRLRSIEGIDLQLGVPRQHVEIAVVVKHCRTGADANRADEAIDQPANGLSLAAAGAIQGGRLVVVGGDRSGENGPARASSPRRLLR